MFGLKWNWLALVAILAALGAQNRVWGQAEKSPPVADRCGNRLRNFAL